MALQNVEANITLDLYNHDTTPATVKAIQLDSQTRYVAAMLQNVGMQYDVDSGATVQLIVVRPDNVGVQITGETFEYGEEGAQFLGPYAELTQVALAVSGKMRGQFKITSGTQILRTEIFAINNGVALDASTDEWADEYDGYNLEEMATSIETNTADIATLEADVSQLKEDLSDISTTATTACNNIMLDEVTEEGEIETTTEYNQDSEIFTMVGGYPNKYGILGNADKEFHKTYYFQATENCKIYAQFDKTYYLCVYNTEPFKSENLVVRTGSTAPDPPTVDTPLSVTAGQYVSFSIYMNYPRPFTLYVITTETGEVTTPTVIGVQKARITTLETDMETAQDNIAEIMNGLPVEYAIDHVLCIGDSLTYGSPADQSTMPYPISQNYPYYLGRMLGLTGNITNGGVPNYGAKTYYHSKFGDYTLTDYNTFIIFLGTNSGLTDTLDTDVNPYTDYADFADTDTGCYCKMIESIYEANPNAIIILVNTWHIASVQPVTRTTIDKIGAKYVLPVVETYDVMRYGVNPIYHGNVDNVHCSKAGYLALANLIKNKIYEYMSTDLNNVNKGMT